MQSHTDTARAARSERGDSATDDPLLRAIGELSAVQRRDEFFHWAQNQLQALLPHQLLVCGIARPTSQRMAYDCSYVVPLDPKAVARLCDARDGLVDRMLACWAEEGGEPLVVAQTAIPARNGTAAIAADLRELGFGATLVHGIPRASAGPAAQCLVAFVSLEQPPGARAERVARLMVPQIFASYSRALAHGKQPPLPRAADEAAGDADPRITDRELEVLRWVREGKSNQEIGAILSISALTVKNHVQKILRKLDASNRAQAVSKAIGLKLLGSAPPRRAARLNGERGFTLLEVLVVLVIIGLLAGIVAPRFFAQVGKSEARVARAQLDALAKALEQYRLDTGRFPNAELGLDALMRSPDGEARWAGPYLVQAAPRDPWGRAYQYRLIGDGGGEVEVATFGKDGQPGGQGEAEDVVVRR